MLLMPACNLKTVADGKPCIHAYSSPSYTIGIIPGIDWKKVLKGESALCCKTSQTLRTFGYSFSKWQIHIDLLMSCSILRAHEVESQLTLTMTD